MIKSSVKLFGKTYIATGKTVLEAISKLKPEVARGASVLVLEKGKARKERILTAQNTMRVFGSLGKLAREIALKQVSQLFDSALFE